MERMLSFSTSARGIPAAFLAGGAVFCFLELGGVLEKPEASAPEASPSLSGTGRFFGAALEVFKVVCVIFFAAGGRPAAFFTGAALAFFWKSWVSMLSRGAVRELHDVGVRVR